MKLTFAILLTVALALISGPAQTVIGGGAPVPPPFSMPPPTPPASLTGTNPATVSGGLSQIWTAISASDVLHATNYLFAPYATYAPKAPTKIGGGIMAVYNVNNYVGLALGLDWLGQFTLVSGNATIKVDTHPLRGLFGSSANTNSFFYNFTATPFALAGAGVDVGGTGSHTIWDIGLQTKFGHWLGGRFGVGGAYGEWIGSSPYDVKRYHFFVNWQKGF